MNNDGRVKRYLATFAAVLVAAHVILAVTTLFLSSASDFRITRFYKTYFLPGPYFSSQRIMTSRHTLVAYKDDTGWRPARDYGQEDFTAYCDAPWRYHKLMLRKMAAHEAWKITSSHDSTSLNKLAAFIQHIWIRDRVDSVELTICDRTLLPQRSMMMTDTVVQYKVQVK